MIFVTVGTHEQQFNRLIQKVDELKRDGIINEPVFMQTGFSTYEPKYCEWKKLIPYPEMLNKVKEASIVITHGGPASFIMPLQEHKIPIVVPRQLKYEEHINDHQVEFSEFVSERQRNIIVVLDIEELEKKIRNYEEAVLEVDKSLVSNNKEFNEKFNDALKKLF